jgi:hypothetical protein
MSHRARLARWLARRVRYPIARQFDRWWDFDFHGSVDELVILHHLGLGDHFICMGLVLELAERHARRAVHLPVVEANLATVRTLYSSQPRVRLLPVRAASAERETYRFARAHGLRVARIGFGVHDLVHWDRSFYAQADVDFEASWSRFAPGDFEDEAQALMRHVAPARPYQLVHDQGSIGRFELTLPPGANRIRLQPVPSPAGLFAWAAVIREAGQIHCIDSSVVHLVDRMAPVPGQELFLHDARASGCKFARHRDWVLVPYPRASSR